jgi:hypothetical protein
VIGAARARRCASVCAPCRPWIERYGKNHAVALAKWSAYQLSIWHEIATWYGYASLADWPRRSRRSRPRICTQPTRVRPVRSFSYNARGVAYGQNMMRISRC